MCARQETSQQEGFDSIETPSLSLSLFLYEKKRDEKENSTIEKREKTDEYQKKEKKVGWNPKERIEKKTSDSSDERYIYIYLPGYIDVCV